MRLTLSLVKCRFFGTNILTGLSSIPADGVTWTHLAASYVVDGQFLRLYVDGVLTNQTVASANPPVNGVGPFIQRIGENFNGLIEEVRMWNVVRTDEEIRNAGTYGGRTLTGAEEGLMAYYRFDDGTSYDGIDGTSLNPDWFYGQIEDFVFDYKADWASNWFHAASIAGGVTWTAALPATNPPVVIYPDKYD